MHIMCHLYSFKINYSCALGKLTLPGVEGKLSCVEGGIFSSEFCRILRTPADWTSFAGKLCNSEFQPLSTLNSSMAAFSCRQTFPEATAHCKGQKTLISLRKIWESRFQYEQPVELPLSEHPLRTLPRPKAAHVFTTSTTKQGSMLMLKILKLLALVHTRKDKGANPRK